MSRYRLLILATRHAIPPDSGYATDVYCAIEQLQKQGVEIRVILVNDGKAHHSEYPPALLAGEVILSKWKQYYALGKALLSGQPFVAAKWAMPEVVALARTLYQNWPFDLVQAAGSFHMVNALAIKRQCGVKVVMRAQNVEHAICERMAENQKSLWRRLMWHREAVLLRRTESEWCRAADLCLPISAEDYHCLQALAPQTPMVIVQAGAAFSGDSKPVCMRLPEKHFVHLGNLDWAPRMEGLLWFLHEVWPLARQRIPGSKLSIAGAASNAARAMLRPWSDKGVEVLGFVPQLETLVQDCAAVIVPMRCGGGIKIRVVTAWANGWPVVGTKLMMEGLPAINEVNCLVADEPSALVEAMQRLCEDVLLRQNLVMAGKELYATEFAWEAIGRKIMTAHLECLRSTNSL